jgi:hypothetical protein
MLCSYTHITTRVFRSGITPWTHFPLVDFSIPKGMSPEAKLWYVTRYQTVSMSIGVLIQTLHLDYLMHYHQPTLFCEVSHGQDYE